MQDRARVARLPGQPTFQHFIQPLGATQGLPEQITSGPGQIAAQLQPQALRFQQAFSQMFARTQDAFGIALLERLCMHRLDITVRLLETLPRAALGLQL
ncbi:hypothetical protein D3C76_1075330 [compost metagenome]